MSTFGTMKQRIADELARSDLTTQIGRAVVSAVEFHERRRFYFNEAVGTLTAVVDQEWYSSTDAAWIATAVRIDSLRITISDRPYQLNKATMDDLEYLSAGSSITGDPTDWCYYRQQVRLYPVPNTERTLTGAYLERFDTLSGDGDTNAWMTDAEELIRLRAKLILFRDVIRDMNEYQSLLPFEAEALAALTRETGKRSSVGAVTAYYL